MINYLINNILYHFQDSFNNCEENILNKKITQIITTILVIGIFHSIGIDTYNSFTQRNHTLSEEGESKISENSSSIRHFSISQSPSQIAIELPEFAYHIASAAIEGNNQFLIKPMDYDTTIEYRGNTQFLSTILKALSWKDLTRLKITPLTAKEFLQRSILFSELPKEHPVAVSKHPMLFLYTSFGLYAFMNALLRNATLYEGQFLYASKEIKNKLSQNDPIIRSSAILEILSICLLATYSLHQLPYKQCVTKRIACVPKQVIEKMHPGSLFTEKAFMSCSGPGGVFAGGGPPSGDFYRTKFTIHSKTAKNLNAFSLLPENEFLFPPFSQFRVLSVTHTAANSCSIELDDIS
jgi:hypothetical protein